MRETATQNKADEQQETPKTEKAEGTEETKEDSHQRDAFSGSAFQ